MEKSYFAVVEVVPSSDVSVWFPDFPGCVTAGATHSQALANACEALQFHIDGMIEDGDAIPEPTTWEDLDVGPQVHGGSGVVVALVTAHVKSKAKRINITIDEALLGLIEGRTSNVSGFLAEAARERLKAR